MTRRLVELVDVLVGNEEDMQLSLGIAGPEPAKPLSLDPSAFAVMIDRVTSQFPNVKVDRDHPARGALGQPASLECGRRGGRCGHGAPTMDLDVVDRVGGGDGFASGLFYGLLDGPGRSRCHCDSAGPTAPC